MVTEAETPTTTVYTRELLEELVTEYRKDPTYANACRLAVLKGIKPRSLVSKLSKMGVYQKQAYVSKNGEPPRRKEFYIEEISELLDIDLEIIETLEKCNKTALAALVNGIVALKTELRGAESA